MISDQLYNEAKSVCDFKLAWSKDCNEAMSAVFGTYQEIDIYNIYAPSCVINSSTVSVSSAAVDPTTNSKVTISSTYLCKDLHTRLKVGK